MIGRVGRFAGSALGNLVKGISKEELAVRLGTDALGGLMAAAYTPGDLGDKLIAGGAATLGGAAGGLALGKLGGKNQLVGVGLDMAGSIGGDMLASRVGEEVMKGKSYLQGEGYMSPYEKLGAEQQQALAAAIQQDVLRQYGLIVPGAPVHYADPSTGMGVS
jgi:hypothetical protein